MSDKRPPYRCIDCQDTGVSATPTLNRPGSIDYAPCRWCRADHLSAPNYRRRNGSWGAGRYRPSGGGCKGDLPLPGDALDLEWAFQATRERSGGVR